VHFSLQTILVLLLATSVFYSGMYQLSLTPPKGKSFAQVETERALTFRYHNQAAEKQALVYIHGKLGSANDIIYSPLKQKLEEQFALFAYDRPGSGHSLERDGYWSWSPDDFSEHLNELLNTEELTEPAILLAHSWGGAIALSYALRYPEKVRGMVLLAPAAYPWPGRFATSPSDWFVSSYVLSEFYLRTVFVPLGKVFGKSVAEAVFSPSPLPQPFIKHVFPLALQPAAFQMAARDTMELREALKKQSIHYPRIESPTIILSSPNDTVVPPQIHGGPLSEALPRGEIRYVENVGHNFIYTASDSIIEAVRDISNQKVPHGKAD